MKLSSLIINKNAFQFKEQNKKVTGTSTSKETNTQDTDCIVRTISKNHV